MYRIASRDCDKKLCYAPLNICEIAFGRGDDAMHLDLKLAECMKTILEVLDLLQYIAQEFKIATAVRPSMLFIMPPR